MVKSILNMKKYLPISDVMILKPEVTIINHENILLAYIPTSDIKEEIGIWDMGQLIGIVDILGGESVEIKKDGNYLILKGKGKQKYELTAPDIIENYAADKGIFEKVESTEPEASYILNTEDLDYINKVVSILKHSNIVLDNDKVIITTLNGDDFSNPNEKEITCNKLSNKKYVFDYNLISKLPKDDYEVTIHRNSKGVIVSLWKSLTEDVKFIIAIKKEL